MGKNPGLPQRTPRPAIVDRKHIKLISLNDPKGQGHSIFKYRRLVCLLNIYFCFTEPLQIFAQNQAIPNLIAHKKIYESNFEGPYIFLE